MIPLPEPKAYAWHVNGEVKFSEDPFYEGDPTEWTYVAALFDADQMKAYAEEYAATIIAGALA